MSHRARGLHSRRGQIETGLRIAETGKAKTKTKPKPAYGPPWRETGTRMRLEKFAGRTVDVGLCSAVLMFRLGCFAGAKTRFP